MKIDVKKTGADGNPRLTLEGVAELLARPAARRWLVDGVMVSGEPMVIGGPLKTLKTSLALDLAVSLATGTPFLGTFAVPRRRRVAVFSGESGRETVRETVERVLRARGESPADCRLRIGFRLPRLARPADRRELRRVVAGEGIDVVFVDPVYLCLLAGGRGASAANLFDVGAILGAAADACAGATLALVHHTTKGSSARPGPTTLSDLSFSGVGEFARQWLLVSRASEYEPGTGRHDLLLSVGGSAGHSSRWRVTVEEGAAGAGRTWQVAVAGVEPARGMGGRGRGAAGSVVSGPEW